MNKDAVDWDAYLKFRLKAHESWWSRWYDTYREQAGDYQNMTLAQSIALLRVFQSLNASNEYFALSEVDITNATIDTIKVEFYVKIHNEFLLVNGAVRYQPVAAFVRDTLPRLVGKFFWKLFKALGGITHKQHQLAETTALRYINDINTVRHIVDWLGFCFAREPFIETSRKSLAVSTNSTSLSELDDTVSIAIWEVVRQKKLPYIPKNFTIFKQYYDIVEELSKRGKQENNAAMEAVMDKFDIKAKTIKRAVELKLFANKICPIEIKDNLPEVHKHLLVLKNSSL